MRPCLSTPQPGLVISNPTPEGLLAASRGARRHGGAALTVAGISASVTAVIHRSPLPDVDIPDASVPEYVLERADELGDKPALIDGPTGRVLTYAQLRDQVRGLAGGLHSRGFGPGDVLALMAPNLPEYAVLFHGVALAGGTITTINPTYTPPEVNHQLTDAGASVLVTVPTFLPAAQAGAEGTGITDTFVLGEAIDGAASATDLFGEPLTSPVSSEADHVVVLPYSSGTTGLSKGVMLTNRNLVANIAQVIGATGIDQDDILMAVLPFFHIYGMQVMMNTGLRAGATVVTLPRFDLEEFLRLHQEHGITRSFVAPPIVVALAKHPVVDQYDLSHVDQVFSGAAPLSAELAEEASSRLGCEVVQGYGMTEMSPVSHLTALGAFKPGSVGVTAPNTETQIVDPATGESLGPEHDGEIWVRGPQVMKGYLNNEQATSDTLDGDGWLHTGDIGHVDPDGHLFVVDRLKELIKYKGFQVPPAELEALLLTHPAVADAAVIGLPDEEAGEIPVAYVALKAGRDVAPEDIQAFVAEQVAHYKQVRRVHLVDEIPKSASGKILRRVLRERAAAG
jgi:acyl-CoA synthetase (AMP-forming)/AMP-acid ligase II